MFEVDGKFFYERDRKPGLLVRLASGAKPLPTPEELWASEAKLDARPEKRRERYRCKEPVEPSDVSRWPLYAETTLVEIAERLDKRMREAERYREEQAARRQAMAAAYGGGAGGGVAAFLGASLVEPKAKGKQQLSANANKRKAKAKENIKNEIQKKKKK